MEFTVTPNNNTEYSVEFNEEVAIIKVRDLNQGLFNTSLVLPIDAWYLLEAQRQEFRRFHMSRVIITNNQEGTLNMEKQVEEMSGYQPYGQLVPAQYQTGSIDYEFHWETGVDYSVNEDGTAERVYEGSIPRRATRGLAILRALYRVKVYTLLKVINIARQKIFYIGHLKAPDCGLFLLVV